MLNDSDTEGRVEQIRTRLSGDLSSSETLSQKEVRQLVGPENVDKLWKEIERQIPKLHLDIKTPLEWRLIAASLILQIFSNLAVIIFIFANL